VDEETFRVRIASLYRFTILVTAIFLAAMYYLVVQIEGTQEQVSRSEQHRAQSLNIAEELRQTSDELTMMARLYTVTGDQKYERYASDILAIRQGEMPRPPGYSPAYWDSILGGNERRIDEGEKQSFEARVGKLHFSERELELIGEAERRLGDQISLEHEAFAAMKGLRPDAQGRHRIRGNPDPAQARGLLHGDKYLRIRDGFMKSLSLFTDAANERTRQEVDAARQAQQRVMHALQALIVLAAVVGSGLFLMFIRRIIRPIEALSRHARKIAEGDYHARNAVDGSHELGTLGNTLNHMSAAIELDIAERSQIEAQLRGASAYARSLIESSPDPLVTISGDGTITDVNEATVRVTGVPRKQLIGSDFSDYFTEPEKARAVYREVFSKGFVTDYPLAIRQPDGKVTEVLYNASAYRNEKGNVAGVLAAARDVTERKRDEERLSELNRQLSMTVDSLQRREREMSLVNKLNDAMQTCRTREEAYPMIGATAGELFPGLGGALAIFSQHGRELETVAQWGVGQGMQPDFMVDDCWALRAGHVYVFDQGQSSLKCTHFVSAPEGGSLCLPLVVRGEIVGLLQLGSPAGAAIGHDQQQLAITLGEAIKLSLSNIKLREALHEQAVRDPLTGLFNRRYLDETLPRELHRALRKGTPLCVAMLDIDHFKRFNDEYGHEAGDEVLKFIGKVLAKGMRASDIVCRFGGEEFTVILLDTDLVGAEERMRQICLEVKKAELRHRDRTLPHLTISVGMAEAPEHGTVADNLLRAADAALYAAKEAGRDRIEVYRHTAKD
jgi:diguanylate cyclase (GGDEF)-like protein/PAS domain S-box-containing protein